MKKADFGALLGSNQVMPAQLLLVLKRKIVEPVHDFPHAA
jgi:hypothetical protein